MFSLVIHKQLINIIHRLQKKRMQFTPKYIRNTKKQKKHYLKKLFNCFFFSNNTFLINHFKLTFIYKTNIKHYLIVLKTSLAVLNDSLQRYKSTAINSTFKPTVRY